MGSLQTPLCDILKIDTPIVQAPIARATNPAMAAAVSNAGGLGMLAFLRRDADEVRRLISETHELTDRPFGGNFILRGLEDTDDRLDACLESGVDVVSFHWDEPFEYVDRIHGAGVLVTYTVGSAEDARRAVEAGVDIIVAQSWEAGGHVRGNVATMALLPMVVDAVAPVPVISAGSIADGRGMAAALMLGADGVWMGTRFVASEEATVDSSYKERIINASETDTLMSSKVFNRGWEVTARALRNSTIEKWEAAGSPEVGQRPGEGEVIAKGADGEPVERYSSIAPYSGVTGDLEGLSNWAGQGVGLIKRVQPAADIVREITEEAIAVLKKARTLIGE
ncbi:MAG: nitronate monooxygenase [Chloroflexi bacterium]|nr:nitronate monooxygenase [Chloroflexota bacterium]